MYVSFVVSHSSRFAHIVQSHSIHFDRIARWVSLSSPERRFKSLKTNKTRNFIFKFWRKLYIYVNIIVCWALNGVKIATKLVLGKWSNHIRVDEPWFSLWRCFWVFYGTSVWFKRNGSYLFFLPPLLDLTPYEINFCPFIGLSFCGAIHCHIYIYICKYNSGLKSLTRFTS